MKNIACEATSKTKVMFKTSKLNESNQVTNWATYNFKTNGNTQKQTG